jgi:hypothetical protein
LAHARKALSPVVCSGAGEMALFWVPKRLKEIATELHCRLSIISRKYWAKLKEELFPRNEIHQEERNDGGF